MSTLTHTSIRAYQLADAVKDMAQRYGVAEQSAAYAFDRAIAGRGERERAAAEAERWRRAARRRFRALMRLADALRDLPLKEGS